GLTRAQGLARVCELAWEAQETDAGELEEAPAPVGGLVRARQRGPPGDHWAPLSVALRASLAVGGLELRPSRVCGVRERARLSPMSPGAGAGDPAEPVAAPGDATRRRDGQYRRESAAAGQPGLRGEPVPSQRPDVHAARAGDLGLSRLL